MKAFKIDLIGNNEEAKIFSVFIFPIENLIYLKNREKYIFARNFKKVLPKKKLIENQIYLFGENIRKGKRYDLNLELKLKWVY